MKGMAPQAQLIALKVLGKDGGGQTERYMFITHDLSVVRHISNEIAVMYLGKCVERAPALELFENPVHPYTQALLKAIPIPNLKARGQMKNVIRGEVTSPINPKPGCRFAARCPHCHDACLGQDIELREVSPKHFVACTLCEGR